MSKRKKITILLTTLAVMTLVFVGFFYYVMTFEPVAEQQYQEKKEVAMTEVVQPAKVDAGSNSICTGGVVKEDVTHSIPEYSYNEVMGSLTFVNNEEFEVPILYGDPSEDFMTAMDSGGAFDPNSSYPGGTTTTVIPGHKNTDFSQLQYVKLGDGLVLNIDGNLYTYKVTDMKVIEDTDVSAVYYNANDLVIYTCYPFTHQDFYSQRYMISASPVSQISC